MVINTLTLSISAVLLAIALISCLINPLMWVPRKKGEYTTTEDNEEDVNPLPPLSVIIQVNDNIDTLERNISLLLNQDYTPEVQFIIVANEGDSAADDLMKRYKHDARLQSTFIPKTSRYISREKLGVTLGVKAARHEWCLLMDALCYPESKKWLESIGRACTDDKDLVIGYCNYSNDSKTYQRYHRLRHYAHIWLEGRKGKAYASGGSNIVFRKSRFIEGDGFRGNLEVVRGEYDFIINKYARTRTTAFVTNKEGRLTETAPTKKRWHRTRIFYIHSCRTMQRSVVHGLWSSIDAFFLHLSWILTILVGIIGAIPQNWMLLGASIISLLMLIIWRTLSCHRVTQQLDADIPAWKIIPMELTSVWRTIGEIIRYRRASKYDFTCHKL